MLNNNLEICGLIKELHTINYNLNRIASALERQDDNRS